MVQSLAVFSPLVGGVCFESKTPQFNKAPYACKLTLDIRGVEY